MPRLSEERLDHIINSTTDLRDAEGWDMARELRDLRDFRDAVLAYRDSTGIDGDRDWTPISTVAHRLKDAIALERRRMAAGGGK